MNNFEIYVKTSALGKTGIHWRSIESEEHQPVKVPDLIKRQVISEDGKRTIVNDLVDEVKPSLIIFRDNDKNKLLLEVTGFESPHRSTQLGRKVLNSIVWIADDLENNEEVLRKIAYNAILSILEKDFTFNKMVEESIVFFELEEFRVNFKKINEFIQRMQPINSSKHNYTESYQEYQIENISTENLEKLAEEIRNNPLPKDWINWHGITKNDGVLVVVTENLEKRTILHKAGVWRGFASRVEEPVKKIAELSQKKTRTIPSLEPPEVENPQIFPQTNQKIRLIIILFIAAVIIMLILVSLKLLFQPQPQQTPQSQTQSQQILELQPQPNQTPQVQSQLEETLETQARQILEPQPQPTQTSQPQFQQEQASETQANLISETQSTQTLQPQSQQGQTSETQPFSNQ